MIQREENFNQEERGPTRNYRPTRRIKNSETLTWHSGLWNEVGSMTNDFEGAKQQKVYGEVNFLARHSLT